MASRDKKIFIYTLSHPLTGEVRYVGKTNNIKIRYANHLKNKKKVNTKNSNWIKSLVNIGLKPEINIVDEVLENVWQKSESDYIKLFKSVGCNLNNHTLGGDIGVIFDKETKRKMRASALGRKLSLETKLRMSISKSGIKMRNSTKIKIGLANSGRKISEQIKLRSRIWNIKNPPILQLDLKGNIIKTWVSAAEAKRSGEYIESCILRCCHNERRSHKKHIWKFKNE